MLIGWTSNQILAFVGLVTLGLTSAAIIVSVVKLTDDRKAARSADERAREERHEDERRQQRARAMLLHLEVQPGPTMGTVSGPKRTGPDTLLVENRHDHPVTDVGIGMEQDGGAPHASIGHFAYIAGQSSERQDLPSGYSRLVVTWSDVDEVLWLRRWVGQDFKLERLTD